MQILYERNKLVYYFLISLIFGTSDTSALELAQEILLWNDPSILNIIEANYYHKLTRHHFLFLRTPFLLDSWPGLASLAASCVRLKLAYLCLSYKPTVSIIFLKCYTNGKFLEMEMSRDCFCLMAHCFSLMNKLLLKSVCSFLRMQAFSNSSISFFFAYFNSFFPVLYWS